MRAFAALPVLLSVLAAGCGDEPARTPDVPSTAAGSSEELAHVHGLGVRDGNLYIATHHGLWLAPSGRLKAERFSQSRQDIMGFSLVDGKRFLGSGHPDPTDTEEPGNLGLIESRDGGKTWKSISLRGEADFHVLEASGRHIYGVNSADGTLMASADSGRTWEKHTPPGAAFSLAIDPRDAQRIVVSTDQGVFASDDAGGRWRPRRDDVGGLLAWPRGDALYLLAGDGGAQVSADGGRSWKPVGNIDGQPSAFLASGNELYAALDDGTVKVSTDGGATWTVRATP